MRPSKTEYQHLGGWCSDIEAATLQAAAINKTVLEIGVWKGRSTIAMAATAKHILSIDHFQGDDYAGRANPSHETIDTISNFRDIISLCIGDWKLVREYLNIRQFQFIYYDADHTYKATRDFLLWVWPSGISFGIHDIDNNPNHAGVKQALNEITTEYSVHDRLALIPPSVNRLFS